VNDNVMGGRSVGGFEVSDGVLVFSGVTNTDGGGFSSIRTRSGDLHLDGFGGLKLRVRGDGRTYTLRVSTGDPAYSYWARFSTRPDAWQELGIPFSEFWPNRRGRRVDEAPVVPADIRELGILINDKNDGPFRLEVDWIQAY
jgi:monofunctional biosynthetic peptidoglycan transglycosylase